MRFLSSLSICISIMTLWLNLSCSLCQWSILLSISFRLEFFILLNGIPEFSAVWGASSMGSPPFFTSHECSYFGLNYSIAATIPAAFWLPLGIPFIGSSPDGSPKTSWSTFRHYSLNKATLGSFISGLYISFPFIWHSLRKAASSLKTPGATKKFWCSRCLFF